MSSITIDTIDSPDGFNDDIKKFWVERKRTKRQSFAQEEVPTEEESRTEDKLDIAEFEEYLTKEEAILLVARNKETGQIMSTLSLYFSAAACNFLQSLDYKSALSDEQQQFLAKSKITEIGEWFVDESQMSLANGEKNIIGLKDLISGLGNAVKLKLENYQPEVIYSYIDNPKASQAMGRILKCCLGEHHPISCMKLPPKNGFVELAHNITKDRDSPDMFLVVTSPSNNPEYNFLRRLGKPAALDNVACIN